MIVRILNEGQWHLTDEAVQGLNTVDDAVEQAVTAGDQDQLTKALSTLLDRIRRGAHSRLSVLGNLWSRSRIVLGSRYFVLDRRGRTPRLPPCPLLAPLAQAGAREPLPSSLARRLARSSRTAPRQPGSVRRRPISDARGNLWSRSRIALGSRLLHPRSPRKNTSSPSSSARRRVISDARGFKPASPLQELRPPSSESDPSGSQASSRPARQRQ